MSDSISTATSTQNITQTFLALKQSPGDYFILWNVLVPLSVIPSMLHYGPRMHELLLFIALLLNPYLMERIAQTATMITFLYPSMAFNSDPWRLVMQNYFLSWIATLFLIVVIQQVMARWAFYRIYSRRFFFQLAVLIAFVVIPDMIIRYTWPYICKQLYNVISKIDNFLNLGLPIAGCRNSVLIIASIMLVLTSLSFFRWYNTCACRFWNQKPFCKCSKSRSDRCKAGQCCSYWTVLRNWIRRTFDCRN